MNTDTPRTDAEQKWTFGDNRPGMSFNCVTVDFAGQLERELAAVTAERDNLRRLFKDHCADFDGPCNERCSRFGHDERCRMVSFAEDHRQLKAELAASCGRELVLTKTLKQLHESESWICKQEAAPRPCIICEALSQPPSPVVSKEVYAACESRRDDLLLSLASIADLVNVAARENGSRQARDNSGAEIKAAINSLEDRLKAKHDKVWAELDEIREILWPDQTGLPNEHRNAAVAVKAIRKLGDKRITELQQQLTASQQDAERLANALEMDALAAFDVEGVSIKELKVSFSPDGMLIIGPETCEAFYAARRAALADHRAKYPKP